MSQISRTKRSSDPGTCQSTRNSPRWERLNQIETERQRAEIRARYGDISEEEMRWRVAALRYGRELTAKALGWDPDAVDKKGEIHERHVPNRGEDEKCR